MEVEMISRTLALSLILCTSLFAERTLLRVRSSGQAALDLAMELRLDVASWNVSEHLDIIVTPEQENAIRERGFECTRLRAEGQASRIDTAWMSYEETNQWLIDLAAAYPQIVSLDTLGYSQEWDLPILGIKVSDNADQNEDERKLLFDGMHHAREPLGNEICLYLADYLTAGYGVDSQATHWVDEVQTWIVPILNTEGFKYLVDSSLTNPWWRKNNRDNNENGVFEPDSDGVDLNRNYDFNWSTGGDPNPESWVYRGPEPFSESETRIIRDLCLAEKFMFSVCYHSYGQIVLYCWNWSGQTTPDHALYSAVAESVAHRTPALGVGVYDAGQLDGRSGMSSNWIYGATGCMGLLIETGTQFIPPSSFIGTIVEANFNGLTYLYERAFGPGLTGHVTDAVTGDPIPAVVEVLDLGTFGIEPRTSDSTYGRYWRVLEPNGYDVEFSHPDYQTCTVAVNVLADSFTVVDVELYSIDVAERRSRTRPGEFDLMLVPSEDGLLARFTLDREETVTLNLYDVLGRKRAEHGPIRLDAGAHELPLTPALPRGVYFARILAGTRAQTMKTALLR
jgi:hypothetical protein